MTRAQRITRLQAAQTADRHGMTLPQFRHAITLLARGEVADLTTQAQALIASGNSPLTEFVREQ